MHISSVIMTQLCAGKLMYRTLPNVIITQKIIIYTQVAYVLCNGQILMWVTLIPLPYLYKNILVNQVPN